MVEKLFWSGGWDPTYTLIQELKKGKTIQPIYIKVEKRIINKLKNIIGESKIFTWAIAFIPYFAAKTLPIKKNTSKKEVGVLSKYTSSKTLEKYLKI